MKIEIANLLHLYCLKENDIKNRLTKILRDLGKDAELSVVFVDDKKIRELNNSFLHKDFSTDVLAFNLGDFNKEENGKIYGEIIVSVETAIRVANKINSDVECEIYLYIVHGLLHLLGYDDKDKKMAEEMHNEEKNILSGFGLNVNLNAETV